jgi:hypothetical protein
MEGGGRMERGRWEVGGGRMEGGGRRDRRQCDSGAGCTTVEGGGMSERDRRQCDSGAGCTNCVCGAGYSPPVGYLHRYGEEGGWKEG